MGTEVSSSVPSVAAVILTLNEIQNIDRCIDSVRWCDDIVVVDSGSCDGTLESAARLGVRTYVHRQEGAYRIADQRNWVIEHCEIASDWILFVDADEVIPAELAIEVRKCLHNDGVDGYQMTPKYMFMGKWMRRCTGFPNWHDRLIRRGKARFVGGVWEHFDDSVIIQRISVPYLHFGNSKGFRDWLERHDRYSTWEAALVIEFLAGSETDFQGARRRQARVLASRMWPLRPLLRFLSMYVLRGGFLEGWRGLMFCIRYAIYEYMIVEKVTELRRPAVSQAL